MDVHIGSCGRLPMCTSISLGGGRGIDLLAPVWHVLDLTPQGRGDWYARLDYGNEN
jgi:predicted dithiol-disulfide oxidoreductase (DUF899 family)